MRVPETTQLKSNLNEATVMTALTPFFTASAPKTATADGSGDFVDGVGIAQLISDGKITVVEVVDAAIARAKDVNPKLNGFAYDGFSQAREAAKTPTTGPFAGVPTVMKDLMDWKGMPTLFGSRGFIGNLPTQDGPLSIAWRKAGVISLGKSNTPEMGLISSTEPIVTGATRNPWDTDRSPGGSSGGAAALVAAGVVPFAHASDGGGSIRIPASACGLVGLKPSRGALPTGRVLPPGTPLDLTVDLAVTRTVRDTAAIYATTALDKSRPHIVTAPTPKRLKIAVCPDAWIEGGCVDEVVKQEILATAKLCESLGHELVETQMDYDWVQFQNDFLLIWAAGAARFAQTTSEFSGKPIGLEILEPWTLGLAQMFQSRLNEYEAALGRLLTLQTAYPRWLENHGIDVFLTPTVSRVAVPIGEQAPDGPFEKVYQSVTSYAPFTSLMNVTGAASISLPLGQSSDRLPIGSMFSGRMGDDELLIELAYQLEEARPWIDRKPPVWAF